MARGRIKFHKFKAILDCYYQKYQGGQFKRECSGIGGLFKSQFGGQKIMLCEKHSIEIQNIENMLVKYSEQLL